MGWILAVPLLLASVQADKIAAAFDAWFRDYRRGSARYEATVFRPLLTRGTREDGKRVLRVLTAEWKRGSRGESPGRNTQDRLLEMLRDEDCPLGIQFAILDWLRSGSKPSSFGDAAWVHGDPELAARLLPLLGAWHRQRFRPLLESFCRGRDPRLLVASAGTLAETAAVASFGVLGRAMTWLEDPIAMRRVVHALGELHEHEGVGAEDRKMTLDLALRRLQDPSVDHRLKEALVGILRRLRSATSVPVLLAELERVHEALNGKQAIPTGLAFYFYELHDALQDLTGFWAPASSPDRWWSFWEQEREGFTVRTKPKAVAEEKTVAKGFFGIPVRGRRVLFVVDTSGSMKAPYGTKSRLERAKEELRTALHGLDPEAEFNVMLFADRTRLFSRSFCRATASRLRALDRLLAKTVPDGSTNLWDALHRGLAGKIHPLQTPWRTSIDEVFVLSDGAPRRDPAHILEDVGGWNGGRVAHIHAVYLGENNDDRSNLGRIPHGRSVGPLRFMRRLAEENGGVFLTPRS